MKKSVMMYAFPVPDEFRESSGTGTGRRPGATAGAGILLGATFNVLTSNYNGAAGEQYGYGAFLECIQQGAPADKSGALA